MSEHEAEAVVIGGGPAGLSATLYLARYARRVVLFDAGGGRSSHSQVNHNYLGFPGGVPALRLRELGREQLGEYAHVICRDERVDDLSANDGGFVVKARQGDVAARTVVLCTGVIDHYPEFPGWEDYVGRSMFWCLTCDGYSNRDRRVVALGHTDSAALEALQLSRFTRSITLLTNCAVADITPQNRELLERAKIPLIEDAIAEVNGADGAFRSIATTGGRILDLEVLFSLQGATPQSDLARRLGVGLNDAGWIVVDSEQKTDVPGVFAAGDVTRLHGHQVSTAVHEGGQAAAAANQHLYPRELRSEPE